MRREPATLIWAQATIRTDKPIHATRTGHSQAPHASPRPRHANTTRATNSASLTRISATLACLGVLTSVLTGFLMWFKRRPSGGTGLPSPANAATHAATPKGAVKTVSIAAVILGVLYPAFGVSLLVVLGVEAVLAIRRRTRDGGAEPEAVRDDLAADENEVPVGADDDGDEVSVGVLQ